MHQIQNTTTEGDVVVAEASTEALIDAIIQLTHRLHGLGHGLAASARATDLRAQRSLCRAELVRRDERRQMLEATRLTVVPA